MLLSVSKMDKKMHGTLGRGKREKLPWCSEDYIKALYSDDDYVGYREREKCDE